MTTPKIGWFGPESAKSLGQEFISALTKLRNEWTERLDKELGQASASSVVFTALLDVLGNTAEACGLPSDVVAEAAGDAVVHYVRKRAEIEGPPS